MGFTQTCVAHIFLTFFFMSSDAEGIITIKENKGQKIPLHCNVSEDSLNKTYTVNWKKNGTSTVLCYYRVSNNTMSDSNCGSRYVIEGRPLQLYLTNVSFSDSGVYNCSVTKLIPPTTEEKFCLVDLTVQGVVIEKLNTSNQDCMELLCRTEGLVQNQLTFHWTRGTSGNEYNASQSLKLCKPAWSDCDTFTCNVSHNNTPFSDTFVFLECSTNIKELIIILYIAAPAGVILIFPIICCCCKYRKRKKQENTTTVFSNKIYENFSFSGPGPTTDSVKQEECIYEN
nr:T-lymphocyte surface antigen Ly-9-like [Paramormyrops kingsleyae]